MSLLERYTQPAESQIPTVSHHGEIPSGQPTCTIEIDGREVTAVVGEAILRAVSEATGLAGVPSAREWAGHAQ